MAFENIDCVKPAAPSTAKVPADGVAISARAVTTRGGGRQSRYIKVVIGEKLARAISLTQPDHRLRVLFGTGPDAGKVQVSVDNVAGKFVARRDKKGRYALTINAATAAGRFALQFPGFVEAACDAIRPVNGQPPHFVFKASKAMLAAEAI